ncbi:MAG: M48 family metalloprotease [Elusimicrobiota bacterium]|jgi:Zn-dependent protease with chaperone function
MKKFIASFIVSILITTAPGLPAYAAVAKFAPIGKAGSMPGGNMGVGRIAVPTGQTFNVSLGAPSLGSRSYSLTPAPTRALPGVMRTLPQTAVSGAQASPAAAAAAIAASAAPAPMGMNQLLQERASLALPAEQVERLSAGQAKASAADIMDRILGMTSVPSASEDVAASAAEVSAASRLYRARVSLAERKPGPPVPANAEGPKLARNGAVSALFSVLRVAAAGGAVFGLQALAAAGLPSVFGLVPVAAVWAVSSGVLLLPLALYARHRLALRDSPRLDKIKWVMDIAIGAYLGAVAIALPSLGVVLTAKYLAAAAVPAAGLALGRTLGGSSALMDSLLTWGSLAVLPGILGLGVAGVIGVGPMLGMMMLPIMTSVAFFLGTIIRSAESGRPFPTVAKIRFPMFQWVMTGVVFALLTGFNAVYSNYAFFAWNFLGEKHYGWESGAPLWKNALMNLLNFNTLYLGLLAFTAATGFASPLTFLVIAFAPERGVRWIEWLLAKLLPKSEPAPSTNVKPLGDVEARADQPARWPNFHYWFKTISLVAGMLGMGVAMGATVFGITSLVKNLATASIFALIPFFFSTFIIKKVMKTIPANESDEPEFFSIIKELRERINAGRAAKGQKPIPMPEMVIDPMEGPNAYATGRGPSHALVGVTQGIKEMTLDPETLRSGLIRLMAASDAGSKSFKVFRKAIAGSIPGIAAQASPLEVAEALKNAGTEDLHALGYRALRGVLGHELSHVMDRHMLIGAITGTIATGVAFASYGVMWAVGHAQAGAKKIKERWFPTLPDPRMGVEPISVGVAAQSLFALLKVFAALWGPVVLTLLQMGSSRSNEGMADSDGALLVGDAESLALALGLLTSWRPRKISVLESIRLPIIAANAHRYTVNPLQQMQNAGVLPKLDAATQIVVGKSDDFLFNLFITHPDTTQRIERLYDMAEAQAAARK